MLSPRSSRVILLPEDRKLIDLLGWDEEQYTYFVKQASTYNDIRPGQPTMFFPGLLPFVIKLVIGLALSYLASLLTPKQGTPPQIKTKTVDGQNIVSSGRYAPRAGFGSTQNVVEIGSVVPVVFAKREQLDGIWYGGVRINTNLLWSQLYSQGTGQLLRAVFMVSEGPIGSLDPRQFAIGDNLLGSYDLETAGNTSGRCSIYFRSGGGLLQSSDHIAGRDPSYDEGNAENSGGASVFDVRGINQAYQNDFCYVSKPSNQTRFGLYACIGNNLSYRVNPVIRPVQIPQLKPVGTKGNSRVTCNADTQGEANRLKQKAVFAARSGVIYRNGVPTSDEQSILLAVGDTFTYHLSYGSDYSTKFKYQDPGPDGYARCVDVAQAIASRQRQWDDSIVVGELYKFGGCYAICTARSPEDEVFVSEAEYEPKKGVGVNISADFKVVRQGQALFSSLASMVRAATTDGPLRNATNFSHIFRAAVSSFIVDRPTQVIEIGYKSTLGLRYSGLMNFRDSEPCYEVDDKACLNYEGNTISSGQTFNTKNISSGTVSLAEKRYSFFRVACRIAGSSDAPVELDINFCVCSQTQQASYNYLRLQFPTAQRWEVTHYPLSGWEVRTEYYPHPLILLDSRTTGAAKTTSSNGFVVNYSGEVLLGGTETFGLAATIPRMGNLQVGPRDIDSYVDAYGALAEVFVYEEVQSSASQPEHEIAYVNLISPNPSIPTYEGIATVGLTLRSGPSFNELSQFSAYVNCGFGATHLFPEVLAIALTNEVFGTGDIVSPAQIDFDSFLYSADWTNSRRYFFDMGVSDPLNIRSKGAEWAKLFLLDLSTKNGKFHLAPIAEFGVQYTPTALFTSGNTDAVTVSERDSQDRQAIRVSVKWREERQANDLSGLGLFPVIRELTVKEAGTPSTAPLVQIDLSEFGTSELHALDAGKMACREQRLVTHDVTLECLPDRAAIEPGAIVKIGMELLAYEQPNNGVILADGSTTATSGASLSDGTYEVVLWNGMGEDLQEVAIVVTDGKVEGYSNCVFCIADAVQTTQTFKLQVISYNDDGNLEITASYYPLDDNGYSLLLENWNDPSAWDIEGLIGPPPPDVALEPPFAGVNIKGPVNTVTGETYVYLSEIDGPEDVYTYAWTGTGVTFSDDTIVSPEVTFTGVGSATINLTVTRTSDSLDRSDSLVVTVAANTSNSLTISGDSSRIGSGDVVLTAIIALPYTTATYEWKLVGEGTLAGDTTDTLTLTLDGDDLGTREVVLSAVIDDIDYSAIKFVSVFESDPLQIAGPAAVGLDTYSYEGILSPELALTGWTFAWTITGNLNASLLGAATGRGSLAGSLSVLNPVLLSGAATGRGSLAGSLSALNTVLLSGAATGTGTLVGTITAAATDPYFSSVFLLLSMNGTNGSTTFIDSSIYARSITAVGGIAISTAQSKWGGASGLFDGTNDRLDFPSAISTTTLAYTVEAWVYATVSFDYRGIFSGRGVGGQTLRTTPSGQLQLLNNSLSNAITTTATMSLNTWHHVAMTNTSAGITTIWLDGVNSGSSNQSSYGGGTFIYVGYAGSGSEYWRGHIDEARYSDVCRYTANFTPPAAAFPFQ